MDNTWQWTDRRAGLSLILLILCLITVYIVIQLYFLVNNRVSDVTYAMNNEPAQAASVDTLSLVNELTGYRWPWFDEREPIVVEEVNNISYEGFSQISLLALVILPDGQGSAALSYSGNQPEVLRIGDTMSNGAMLISIHADKVLLEKDSHQHWLILPSGCFGEQLSGAIQSGISDVVAQSAKECAQ